MLMHIQSVQLFLIRYPQADGQADHGEDKECQHRRVHKYGYDSGQLCNEAASFAEYTGKQSSHQTAAAMYAYGAYRIIHTDHLVDELDGEYDDKSGGDTDDNGLIGSDDIAAGGDGHETGQRSVQSHGDVGLAVTDPGE